MKENEEVLKSKEIEKKLSKFHSEELESRLEMASIGLLPVNSTCSSTCGYGDDSKS